MPLGHHKSVLTLAVVGMTVALSSAQGTVADPAAGMRAGAGIKTVALSPGVCASVADGDLVTLTWNPGFSPAVSGLHGMTLLFAQPGSPLGKNGMPHSGFVLWNLAAKPKPGMEKPIAALQNGFFLSTFRADLADVQPGKYTLVDATMEPERDAAEEVPPVMTNSPKNSYFCLEVTSSPAGKKR